MRTTLKSSFGRSRGQYLFKVENMWFTYMATWHEGLSLTWVRDDSVDSNASRNVSGSFAFHQHVEKHIKWGWTHRSWKSQRLNDDFPCRRMPLDFSPHAIIQPNASVFFDSQKDFVKNLQGFMLVVYCFFLQILKSQSLFETPLLFHQWLT